MGVKHIHTFSEFAAELEASKEKLLVAAFVSEKNQACQDLAPVLENLSNRHEEVKFCKISVTECKTIANSYNIRDVPVCLFFYNAHKIDSVDGSSTEIVTEKVKEWMHTMELAEYVDSDYECLNESDRHTIADCLEDNDLKYLESDCDEQLILHIPFRVPVKLCYIAIKTHGDNGPKEVKLFNNQMYSMGFDELTAIDAVQTLEFTPEQLAKGEPVALRPVKFASINSVQLFVVNNQNDSRRTRIHSLKLYGSPKEHLNMGNFKRVSGRVGEAH
ncbi:putative thioredoxin [Trichinella nativa]|uniref:Putative thioredoxin n=1 Tax=Trichinella nativa TaxID=6335 RepID=A0A1Y3E9J9_9BILA|nr:putative thioredoxin [Trichinella nativa]